jgi:RNA recognition motif-containing protein
MPNPTYQAENPMKILIRNLDRNTTEAELRSLFTAHGSVQSCTLVTDKDTGHSKGFGYVEMPKVGEAKAAIKQLNGQQIGINKIRVKKAEPKPNDNNAAQADDE